MTRVGLDATIFLRALLNDDPQQSSIARELLASLGEERRGYLGISALLEIFWVLRSRYRVPRQALYETVRELLMTRHLDVESSDAVAQALAQYQRGRADFEGALIAGRNVEAGCSFTYTFDKTTASRVPSMELLA